MLANILVEPGRIALREMETPEPSYGEILVRVKAALTCGTDLKAFLRGHDLIPMPGVFGHEFSGVVAEAGRGVARFKEGDAVMAVHTAPCLRCFFCRRRLYNLCEKIMHTKVLGAFAEYILLPSHIVKQNVFHKPKNLSFEEASFLEPLSCVVHSVDPLRIKKGDSAFILGAGPIGLLHLLLLKRKGVKVAVADIKEERLKIAKKLGADFVFRTPSPQSPPLKGGEEQGDVPSGKGKYKEMVLSKGGSIKRWSYQKGGSIKRWSYQKGGSIKRWSYQRRGSGVRCSPQGKGITPPYPPYLPPLARGELKRGLTEDVLGYSFLLPPLANSIPSNPPLANLIPLHPPLGKLAPLRPPFGKGGQGGILKTSAAGLLGRDIGFDYVFECTGMPDVWEASINYVRRGGTVILFGGCKSGTTATYDTRRLHYDEITLRGVFHYTPSDVKTAYKLLREGKLGVSRLISGRYPLTHTQKVFEKLSKGIGIKYVIVP